MTFRLEQDGRVIHSVPGSRLHAISLIEAQLRVREALAKIDPAVLVRLPREPDDEPLLGALLAECGPCVNTASGYAILPRSRRFNIGDKRLFAARTYANGYTGYVIAPSDFRPGPEIWGHSDSGLLRNDEYAMPSEWLLEFIEPLVGRSPERSGDELWTSIERDLRKGEPPPPWSAPVQNGIYEHVVEGVVTREEQYRDGKRNGTLRWWALVEDFGEELSPDMDIMDVPDPTYRRGPLIREGTFVDGAAHGAFRFFDDRGKPTYEVTFEHGWPEGTCIVHPEAASGIYEPATIEYRAGVPTRWTIPPLAYSSVALERAGKPPATLAELADGGLVVLVDCTTTREHSVDLGDVLIIGIGEPGRGRVGSREIEVVADPDQRLTRAYGHEHRMLLPVTVLAAGGQFRSGGQLAPHMKRSIDALRKK